MKKDLVYNQENVFPKQYQYYPSGQEKAVLVHILSKGECSKCYEEDRMNYTDGNKVWQRIWHKGNE